MLGYEKMSTLIIKNIVEIRPCFANSMATKIFYLILKYLGQNVFSCKNVNPIMAAQGHFFTLPKSIYTKGVFGYFEAVEFLIHQPTNFQGEASLDRLSYNSLAAGTVCMK